MSISKRSISRFVGAVTVAVVAGVVLVSCAGANAIKSAASINDVHGLNDKLRWIKFNGQSGETYVIEVAQNENGSDIHLVGAANEAYTGRAGLLEFKGRSNITVVIRGVGENQTIRSTPVSLGGTRFFPPGPLFLVDDGVTLILENVTVKGPSKDDVNNNQGGTGGALIGVLAGGTLIMEEGSAVIDGFNNARCGGGVAVNNGGTFHMRGGTIAGNVSAPSKTSNPGCGGGVFVNTNGTFTKTGGTIFGDNRRYQTAQGTYVHPHSTVRCNLAAVNPHNISVVQPGRGHAVYAGETALDENIGPEVTLSFINGQMTIEGNENAAAAPVASAAPAQIPPMGFGIFTAPAGTAEKFGTTVEIHRGWLLAPEGRLHPVTCDERSGCTGCYGLSYSESYGRYDGSNLILPPEDGSTEPTLTSYRVSGDRLILQNATYTKRESPVNMGVGYGYCD